jgi:hypothetical protein
MHLDLTGREAPAASPVHGRVVMVEGYDIRSAWLQLRGRSLTPKEWWSSWRTVRETAWLAPDDMVPALVALTRGTGRIIRPPSGRPRAAALPRFLPGRAMANHR